MLERGERLGKPQGPVQAAGAAPPRRNLLLAIALGFVMGLSTTQAYLVVRAPASPRQVAARPLQPLRQPQIAPRPIEAGQLGAFTPLPDLYDRQQMLPYRDEMDLGRMFFFDERFSKNQDISCNSCHPLDRYGMDGRGVSIGHLGQTGRRNAPTVYNAAGSGFQFWDGRANGVEQQALMPVVDAFEMAMTEERVVQTIRSIPEYVAALQEIFPNDDDPVTFRNFGYVIGAFERGLVTPSRWDRFLVGDELALTEKEKEGFSLFFQLGCPSCHSGRLIGGTHFEMLGAARPWPNQTDLGRNQLFDSSVDMPSFKVASLRNVAMTAPYFHDASSDTLEDAVRRMGEHQLGLELRQEHIDSVVAWLKSLTGALPELYIRPPTLPPSTSATPPPERDGY